MTDQPERPEPPVAGSEVDTLLGALDRQRYYISWKCGNLDSVGLTTRLEPSTITLGGLLKHLAHVEDDYFSVRMFGNDPRPPWDSMGWEWDWNSAADDPPERIYALWQASVDRSRALIAEALAAGDGLDQPGRATWPDGRNPTLRRYLIDMVEEYARHVGHADLIRESIDGLVGEDPAD